MGKNRETGQNLAVIGCGPGHADYIIPAARLAARDCRILFGAARLLDLFPEFSGEKREIGGDIDQVLREVAQALKRGRIGVLVSGDPGCFSLAGRLKGKFGRDQCRVIPGVSSVQLALARLGLDWIGVSVLSAHGRNPPDPEEILGYETAVVLAGRDVKRLTGIWDRLHREYIFYCCSDLGLPGESILRIEDRGVLETCPGGNALLVLEKR